MAVFNGAFPVLPGKVDEMRRFASKLSGERQASFDAHHRRAGNVRETLSLQETPMGALLLVWFEGDIEKAFTDLATAKDEFGVWFRDRVQEITGIDLSAPASGLPELLVDWNA